VVWRCCIEVWEQASGFDIAADDATKFGNAMAVVRIVVWLKIFDGIS
jgi:hypothetical protein